MKFVNQLLVLFGCILEHHDKALFAFLAPFISSYFFPTKDLVTSLIELYGVIVLSLLVRPVAALYFGSLADRKGRKRGITISMIGMAFMTMGMGFLPSYENWGYFSPLLLFIFRCGQNFFITGEVSNGSIFLLEHTQSRYKAFFSSLFDTSIMVGILFASLEITVFAYFDLLENYWQWLFIGAGGISFALALFRSFLVETPEFENRSNREIFQWKDLLNEKKTLVSLVLISAFSYATYIFSITFVNAFIKVLNPMNSFDLTRMNTILIVIDCLALPCFGWLSFYIDSMKMMRFAALMTAILAIPLFIGLSYSQSLTMVICVRLIIMLLGVCFAAPHRAWAQERIAINKKATLVGLGNTIGQVVAEGPLTMLSLYFLNTGLAWAPGILVAFLSWMTVRVITQPEWHQQKAYALPK